MRTPHLFAGAGGGLLADLILGHQPVLAVDIDPMRCDLLRIRTDEGWFPGLSVICADATTWDGSAWNGRVDILHAGIPCPRWSGCRRGRGNPPDLWPAVHRIVGEIRPALVFLECVAAYKRDHERTADDLASIGYSLSEPLITDAASLGAPYYRARYWALGRTDGHGQPDLSEHAEVAILPPADAGPWWEADPRDLRMDDGVANRMDRFAAIGDGQVPLQAAVAWRLLGGE